MPTTHHTLTLLDPRYPKSHFDLINLVLLGSQIVLFLLWPRIFSRHVFFWSFVMWRAAYNAGLGWILTKQSKCKWIVRQVQNRGWLDGQKRPKVRQWVCDQLSVKMGRDYGFEVSSLLLPRGLVRSRVISSWAVAGWRQPHLPRRVRRALHATVLRALCGPMDPRGCRTRRTRSSLPSTRSTRSTNMG